MKTTKIIKTIMAALPLIMPLFSLAKTETVNGFTWTYTVANGKATIAGSYTYSDVVKATIPSELGGYPVTSIGPNTFKECETLWCVIIPDSVTNIGSNAFYWCENLESVTLPDSITSIGDSAFFWCPKLTDLTLPDSLTTIGECAFCDCRSLTGVNIPAAVKSIGKFAFSGCDNLRRVDITDLSAWCRISFDGDSANPLYYAHNLYLNGTLLKKLSIPSTVTSIKNYAFSGWGWNDGIVRPVSVTIPTSVKSIGDCAFYGCSGLTDVMIPDSVTKIGQRAFNKCSILKSVTIPDGVTSIGASTFYHCDGLTNVTIGAGVTSIGASAFQYCDKLTSVAIPSSVDSIGKWAFNGCDGLTNLTMNGDCPTIGSGAFGKSYGVVGTYVVYLPRGNSTYTVTNGKWQGMTVKYYNGFYTITFDANGGAGGMIRTLEYGTALVAPTVTRVGYVFSGWSPSLAATVPARDVTYKAQWTPRQYTVTFDANGGIGGTNAQLNYGTTIPVPAVTRAGYSFLGWSPAVASTVPANDVTYTAQWVANSYTIAYDANGGTGTTDSTAAIYDQDATLATNGFTCYAKQFAGWATEPGGAVVYSAGQKVRNLTTTANGTVTLYAVWEPLVVSAAEASVSDGTTFCGDSYTVTLSCPLDGTTIYYTTNGVTPRTSAAFAYTEPIVIYGSANIVAIAVKDGVKSGYTRVSIEQITPDTPVIMPADGTEFRSEVCEVTIHCATEGAEIYYTVDGSTPQKNNGTRYTAPFTIANTTTIKAVAIGGPLKSEVATATIAKRSLSLAEATGATELKFDTDESVPWIPVVYADADNGFAAQSGTIGLDSATWMETTVIGKGTFSFKWRVECEEDDSGQATWDRFMVFTNGVEIARIDGITEWERVSFMFDDIGQHTIRWVFLKDDYDEEGIELADHGWVSGVVWEPYDPLPPLDAAATDNDAQTIIVGLSDVRLSDNIRGTAAYTAFRNWVDDKGVSHLTVRDAPNAWLSYVLDAPGLMAKPEPLASEDVVIESIAPSSTVSGMFDLIVSIAGAEIGEGARLAETLGIEGATELDESAFSPEGLTVSFERTADGKVKANVTPEGSPTSFFLRVRVK